MNLSGAAIARKLEIGHAIELDLLKGDDSVIRHFVAHAREMMVDAAVALTRTPPVDIAEITRLQNEAKRFGEMVGWACNGRIEAKEAYESLDPDERSEVDAFLQGTEVNDA